MKSIGVFCGASHGFNDIYRQAAVRLGAAMAVQGITLVFGGGRVGLMGTIADAVLDSGGKAIGVIPQSLQDREAAHQGLTELHVVQTMHERKALMAARSEAFIAMPGGFGTLDEINEIITWNQLGIICKPVAFYNVNSYYDKFLEMIDHSVAEGFIQKHQRQNLVVADNAALLLQQLQALSDEASSPAVDFGRI